MKKNICEKNFLEKNLKTFLEKKFKQHFWIKNVEKNFWKKFQVVQTTASLCNNMISKKKVKKNDDKSQKRGLATTVQPEPDFPRTCSFRKVLGINEDCLNAKFH